MSWLITFFHYFSSEASSSWDSLCPSQEPLLFLHIKCNSQFPDKELLMSEYLDFFAYTEIFLLHNTY